MKNSGFRGADASTFYGPYAVGQGPATSTPVPGTTENTATTKAKNGWMTPEMKSGLFNTVLDLGSTFAKTKLQGGQGSSTTVVDNSESGDSAPGGIGTFGIIGISVAVLAIGGTVFYFARKGK